MLRNIPPSSYHQQRRRRMICYEATESSDDDSDRHSSRADDYRHHRRHRRYYHRRSPPHSDHYDHYGQTSRESPTQMHDAFDNGWRKTERASQNAPQGNNGSNFNSRWQAMKNAPGPMPSQEAEAVRNVWNRAANAPERRSNFPSNSFNRMDQAPGPNFQQSSAPPTDRAAISNFLAARNLPGNVNQPNSAVANAWNRADRAAQNLPPPTSAVNSVWDQIQRSPPPQPPIQQPFYPQGSAANSVWNQLQRNSAPPPYSQPPMGGAPQNPPYFQPQAGRPPQTPSSFRPPISGNQSVPNANPAPTSFGALLARSHQQQSPYAGAAYPYGGPSY